MSKLNQKVTNILDYINSTTEDLDNNERAMVLLLLEKLIQCAIELDIVDTLRSRMVDE